MTLKAVMFSWDGETMVPHARFMTLCRRQYVEGEDYALGPVNNVPGKSRAHFFASVGDTWDNLPDRVRYVEIKGKTVDRWPSFEHFRHWLLVQVGWSTQADYVYETEKDARKTAIALRRADQYAVIVQHGGVVKYASAKSIAGGAISAEDWRWVKRDALDLAASLTGTTRTELERHSKSGGAR